MTKKEKRKNVIRNFCRENGNFLRKMSFWSVKNLSVPPNSATGFRHWPFCTSILLILVSFSHSPLSSSRCSSCLICVFLILRHLLLPHLLFLTSSVYPPSCISPV